MHLTQNIPFELSKLHQSYRAVRAATEALCQPLEAEDFVVQSMPDASPTKWHIAHVTWFFETMVLLPQMSDYTAFDPRYKHLFNSYYNSIGSQFPRPRRGLLTRPTLEQVMAYRSHVDQAMGRLFDQGQLDPKLAGTIQLGINHEQQHQELLLMDIKHAFFQNPLFPAYHKRTARLNRSTAELAWQSFADRDTEIGAAGPGFCFDNEMPRHTARVGEFQLASRMVRNSEFLEFIDSGGYQAPTLWLSDGWTQVQQRGWQAPLYWVKQDEQWFEFGLDGLHPLNLDAPVAHLSLYEADAYASWADSRLPSELEWEVAATGHTSPGNFAEQGVLSPLPAPGESGIQQLLGDLWEWTRSAYQPYPGFRAASGPLGEYNGKFMCNQMVLRGGSCVTPGDHIRPSYRNFFYPHMRWQFGGLRLARDL